MALLLTIDTAVQSASVCLSDNGEVIDELVNPSEKDSASWLHVAIEKILAEKYLQLQDLKAIAVSAGPGSYTGLRVGMAAAKGLCYALKIPLITVNTLQMMAAAVESPTTDLLCPMIDARRMEVFTALYNSSLQEVLPSTNLILETGSFEQWLTKHTITFLGNGSIKAQPLITHLNAKFVTVKATASHMVKLAANKFEQAQFSDLAYTEPFYGKDFHSPVSTKFY
jgi:tRNA threonylcarbamoyladenosine biosynthesis protein TsaB